MFPLTDHSVLDYFSLSQFYDRTCINEQFRMQTRFTESGAISSGGLENMVGIEYAVRREACSPPRLFIVHKLYRHGPADTETLASYYVLDGTIYQAPNLLSLLRCRLSTSLKYLNDAVQMGFNNLRFDPALKSYVLSDQAALPGVSLQNSEQAIENRTLQAFFNSNLD